ncbi:glycosyltransferase family 2 protein [Pararhodobacter zhoushanensis]|uniref:glycosyltransferase family 2 protein n=1 Tax=Pararhodobacter zhoushanensis TaxID=2479545 RepID=UPI000F8D2F70|nr:glycosyltransferase family 2 protein [Pararhodobacter zhoushanensis]
MTLTVVILTRDEAQHIARAIRSVQAVADRILVVDSGSADATAEIARDLGAEVLVHPFVTQARQFNWALDQLPADTDWIFRLDADEVVSPELARALATRLPALGPEVAGAEVLRRMAFLGRQIRWGGLFPVPIVRVLRHGRGRSEDRWMDEHILLDGTAVQLDGELLDDNLKPLGWWIDKHNAYASREAIEVLDAEFGFLGRVQRGADPGRNAGFKRLLKDKVYTRLPGGFRALAYFLYRYVVRLGFLDGPQGTAFHVLQGFWYRYLVDMKLFEVRAHMRRTGTDAVTAIRTILNIDPTATRAPGG